MLKLKFQYFSHWMQRADSLESTLMLEKIEGRREGEDKMVGWHHDLMEMSMSKLWDILKDREAWCAAVQRVRHDLATEQQTSH